MAYHYQIFKKIVNCLKRYHVIPLTTLHICHFKQFPQCLGQSRKNVFFLVGDLVVENRVIERERKKIKFMLSGYSYVCAEMLDSTQNMLLFNIID